MASLTEVYEGEGGAGLRRLYAGVALFAVGAILLVASLVVAATGIRTLFGLSLFEARELAGILGGLGLPALLVGTMAVLPRAAREIRAGAAVGALVCLVGVALFRYAYPYDWVGGSGNTSMTVVVAGTYFVGALIATWCLFVAVANFKARNDPGGTVTLEITKGGETRIVEVSNDDLRGTLGGIGLLGGTPDGNVETQTNRSNTVERRETGTPSPTTDGGATTDDAVFLDEEPKVVGDNYCGNCTHFRYVRTDDGMVPYCDFDGETMDDMDACEQWTPN